MRTAIAVLLLAVLLAGCRTAAPRTDIPEGWVSVKARGDVIRSAVSPTGNRLVVTRHDNPPEGTLAFWTEVLRGEFVEGRGYELLENMATSGRRGRPGHEFLFRVTRPEGTYLYLLAVWVEGGSVTTAEAAGPEDAFRDDLNDLRHALR